MKYREFVSNCEDMLKGIKEILEHVMVIVVNLFVICICDFAVWQLFASALFFFCLERGVRKCNEERAGAGDERAIV